MKERVVLDTGCVPQAGIAKKDIGLRCISTLDRCLMMLTSGLAGQLSIVGAASMNISVVNHKSLDSIDGGTTRVRSIVHGLVNHGHKVWYSCYGDGDRTSEGPNLFEATVRKPALRLLRRLARSSY